MKLSIITLTLNNIKYTKKYIESLYKYTQDFELIIVDNGSTDGTLEYIESLKHNNIKLIKNSENLGFSKGNNQGIEIADGEYIGFLNNDILLYPKWFEEIEKVFENEKVAFVSPRHINPHFDNVNEKNYIEFFKKNRYKYKKSYHKSFDECVFSCVITKKDVLDNIGHFDETYTPAFFEDNDLKYRAILKGYGVFVTNTICFFHYGSITSKSMNYNFEKNRKYYYSKYPFAEYLSENGGEIIQVKLVKQQLQKFPLNIIYNSCVFFNKVSNKLSKGFRK